MDAALAMLGRRRYSTPRLYQRLLEKYPDQDPDPVLLRLRELGLLDDRSYARDFVADRLRRRGQGPLKIKAALLAEGLGEELIGEAIRSETAEGGEREQARVVLQKYLRRARMRHSVATVGPTSGTEASALRSAAYRHLRSRGFADDTVCDLLRESL